MDVTYVQNRGLVAPAGIPEDARKTIEVAFQKYMMSETFKKYVVENMLSEAWMDGPTLASGWTRSTRGTRNS